MIDDGYLGIAKDLLAQRSCGPDACQAVAQVLDIADLLPTRSAGIIMRVPGSDAEVERLQQYVRNRPAWLARLRDAAGEDPLTAYAWLAFVCGTSDGVDADPGWGARAGRCDARPAAAEVQGGELLRPESRQARGADDRGSPVRRGSVPAGPVRQRAAAARRGGGLLRAGVCVASPVADPDAVDRRGGDDGGGVRPRRWSSTSRRWSSSREPRRRFSARRAR